MKITQSQLRQIIKEELESVLDEKIEKVGDGYYVTSKSGRRLSKKPHKTRKAALAQLGAVEASKAAAMNEEELDEKKKKRKKKKKKKGKSDRCTRIAKRKYDVWPSAYASGAVVKCRQGKIWKDVKEEADPLDEDLRKWFDRKGEKGSKGGWVDCNAPDGDGGYKECAQGDRKKKPACRPTPSACKDPGKGKKWGKKATNEMITDLVYEYAIFPHLNEAFLEEGDPVCVGCLGEQLYEASCDCPHLVYEAEYQGRKVKLNKPMRGDVKKFKVYVKDPKTGNVKKVNFGHGGSSAKAKGEKTMKIRKNNPKARKSFRARHNCKNPGPKTKARYWSCKKW